MSKRPTKHKTTPRPIWKFFRSKNLRNVENSEGTRSQDPVHLDKVENVTERMKDPFSFPSDSSWTPEGIDASTDSSWTSLGSDTDSDDDIKFIDSVFITEKTEENEILELSSPEKMRFRDRDDDIQFRDNVFNSIEIEEYDFRNPKFASTKNEGSEDDDVTFLESVIPATKTRKNKFGNPKLTSTRNEGNKTVASWESTINSTKTKKYDFGNPKLESTRIQGTGNDAIFPESATSATITTGSQGKGSFIDSHCVDSENYPQSPVGIDYIDNFIKTPPLEDFDYRAEEEVMEVNEESLIPISLKTFVNKEDEGHISKFSEGKESPEMDWSSFNRYYLKSKNLEGSLITTVNSNDIVDDVFKTSNDTSRFKMNNAILQKTVIEESQKEKGDECKKYLDSRSIRPSSKNKTCSYTKLGKNKRRRHVRVKNASVAENQDSNSKPKKQRSRNQWKRHVSFVRVKSTSVTENPDSSINQKRRRRRNRRKKTKPGSNIAKYEEHVKDLRIPEISLSRSSASFPDSKGPVSIKKEEKFKPQIKRPRKRTQNNKEKWNKYKKYLQSIPVCDLNIKKEFPDTEWGANEKKIKPEENNKRRGLQTKLIKKEWNEHKNYLESLPICDLNIKKTFSDNEWGDNKSGITSCLSIKKN